MVLQWKVIQSQDHRTLEIPVESTLFVVLNKIRKCFVGIGRIQSGSNSQELLGQLQNRLSGLISHSNKKEDFEIYVFGKDLDHPQFSNLTKFIEGSGFSFKIKHLRTDGSQLSKTSIKLSLATGELWVPKQAFNNTVQKKLSILIVEDSPSIQKILHRIYSGIEGVEVVGSTGKVSEAIELFRRLSPQFVSLDMKLEGGTGIDFLKSVDLKSNTPQIKPKCVLVTECSKSEGNLVFDAMDLGAIHYLQKPQPKNIDEFSKELESIIRDSFVKNNFSNMQKSVVRKTTIPLKDYEIIAIGSSTGGTEIVRDIIAGLPKNCPPIIVVQHMPEMFSALYAHRLERQTGRKVYEVSEQRELVPGQAYIAAGGFHMVLEKKKGGGWFVAPKTGDHVNKFKPSVSVLFESIVNSGLSSKTVALMLTGMGFDGAREMLNLKNKGAVTIGQSKESCVVYGMPRAAEELGALTMSASPEEMIQLLSGACKKLKETA